MTMVGVGIHDGLVDPYHHGEHQLKEEEIRFLEEDANLLREGVSRIEKRLDELKVILTMSKKRRN